MRVFVINLMVLLFMHWLCDFVYQPRSIADKKHRSAVALLTHGFMYTAPIACLFTAWFGVTLGAALAFVTFMSHIAVDSMSSRLSHWFFEHKKNPHAAFVVIGLDQFIHVVMLLVCLYCGMRDTPIW